jgi:hypothetical protein
MISCQSLRFPIQPDETATSFVSRLTQYCNAGHPADLCLDFGFRWQDFVRGDNGLLDQVAEISGNDPEDVARWAVKTVAPHRFEVAGETAVRGSFVRSRNRVCPRCLLADRAQFGYLGPHRRPFWQFSTIRGCPVHEVPLITLPAEQYTIQNYDFLGQIGKHWGIIEDGAARAVKLPKTDLEGYLVGRLRGRRIAPFLDSLPLYIATRLCEMLGFVVQFGPERQVSDAGETELSQAGEAGFRALRHSEQDLYVALDGLVSPVSRRTVRHQSDFGALFEWFRNASLGPEFEALKDKIRDYIFRTYPFRAGDVVMGKACTSPAVFSINGACRELKMER